MSTAVNNATKTVRENFIITNNLRNPDYLTLPTFGHPDNYEGGYNYGTALAIIEQYFTGFEDGSNDYIIKNSIRDNITLKTGRQEIDNDGCELGAKEGLYTGALDGRIDKNTNESSPNFRKL